MPCSTGKILTCEVEKDDAITHANKTIFIITINLSLTMPTPHKGEADFVHMKKEQLQSKVKENENAE